MDGWKEGREAGSSGVCVNYGYIYTHKTNLKADLVDLDVVDLVDAHDEHVPAQERQQPLLRCL
jgi:hypothetical protein